MQRQFSSNQLNIVTLNGKRYVPFVLHQLPKNYEEVPLSAQFSYRGYTYIALDWLNSFRKDVVTFSPTLDRLGCK
jgi:hypothetical protein